MLTLLTRLLPPPAMVTNPQRLKNLFRQVVITLENHRGPLLEIHWLLKKEICMTAQPQAAARYPFTPYELMVLQLMLPGGDPQAEMTGEQIVLNHRQYMLLQRYLGHHLLKMSTPIPLESDLLDADRICPLYYGYPTEWIQRSFVSLVAALDNRTNLLTWPDLCKL
ncbi:hypothetical protein [Spirosoma koreense]